MNSIDKDIIEFNDPFEDMTNIWGFTGKYNTDYVEQLEDTHTTLQKIANLEDLLSQILGISVNSAVLEDRKEKKSNVNLTEVAPYSEKNELVAPQRSETTKTVNKTADDIITYNHLEPIPKTNVANKEEWIKRRFFNNEISIHHQNKPDGFFLCKDNVSTFDIGRSSSLNDAMIFLQWHH